MKSKASRQKRTKKRVVQYKFKVFTPSKEFNYPVLLFEDVKEINVDELFAVVLYKDVDTKEWVLFLVKKNEDFLVFHIPDAVAWLLNDKTKSSIVVINSKFEDIDKKEGKILPFGRELPEK